LYSLVTTRARPLAIDASLPPSAARAVARARWLVCAVFACSTACASLPRPAFPLRDANQALQRREASLAGVNAIRAEARVEQRGKQGRVRGTVLMFVERAGRVRFDVMTQFGPLAILTSDGTKFAYADFRENRYLTGDTCPQNIARLLGVPLTAADTARFLLGGTPVLDTTKSELHQRDDGSYTLSLTGTAGEHQTIDLAVYASDLQKPADQQRLYLLRSELTSATGVRVWRVSYEDMQPVGTGADAVLMPRRVRVEQPASSSDTEVHFKEIAKNPSIPDDAFVQSPHAGMQEEEASCD
jgi:outer membrane lipoprotein-sorting protein